VKNLGEGGKGRRTEGSDYIAFVAKRKSELKGKGLKVDASNGQ